ncbi:MAG: anti-phage deoxyguanosine triphosphatase [Deltaproteobacteria bacterium]|nr:anti-phage deoxyguanosine triphosphatase [Deltaproteobacteria bacterium]
MIDRKFRRRYWGDERPRPKDRRNDYQRDKARVVHSSAFRRLQAKTQVMGVGEGDFHRTRLTHSIEAAGIGEGLLSSLRRRSTTPKAARKWLPPKDLLVAACLAHDLGHPPFGHGGEKALHARMVDCGGFEANGQTLRIVSRLEKYKPGKGMNPTRRLVLALLKYPVPYSVFDRERFRDKPPKCYFDTEEEIVGWAFRPFDDAEVNQLRAARTIEGKPAHRTLDSSLMEMADDIAYGVHDLEDIVARKMVRKEDVIDGLRPVFDEYGKKIGSGKRAVYRREFGRKLFTDSFKRKRFIGKLVNLFITSARVLECEGYSHPLLKYYIGFERPVADLLKGLKELAYKLVIERPEVQQLERRGQRIVEDLFDEIVKAPTQLVPKTAWETLDEGDTKARRVCDYIAGMTDHYAEKIYGRLFIPGEGSSQDEL